MSSIFRRSIAGGGSDLDRKSSFSSTKSTKVSKNMKTKISKENCEMDKENFCQNDYLRPVEYDGIKKPAKKRLSPSESEMEVIYPDTLTAYLESLGDEIKCDLQDLWKSSVRYLFPGAFKDSENKVQGLSDLQCLEVKDAESARENMDTNTDLQQIAVRRMRLPSTWSEKVDKDLASKEKVSPAPPTSTATAMPTTARPLAKGKRISLAKLYNSNEAIYYECMELGILILGQKKMIYVEKNLDLEGTAYVVWWLMFHELSTCLLSYQILESGSSCVQLQLGSISGETYAISMTDALSCAKVIQSIQEKRADTIKSSGISSEISAMQSISNPKEEDRTPTKSTSPKKHVSPEIAAKVIEAILSPSSSTKAVILARQLQHGVSELGLRMKLENEGISEEKMNVLIAKAQNLLTEGTHTAPATTKESVTLPTETIPTNCNSSATPARETSHLKKYQLMLKHGVPFPAVQTKMMSDGVSSDDQIFVQTSLINQSSSTLFTSYTNSEAPISTSVATLNEAPVQRSSQFIVPNETSPNHIVIPSHLKKFHLMMKHGVPKAAVLTKMSSEGISDEDQALVASHSSPLPTRPFIPNPRLSISPSKSSTSPMKSAELPEDLKKYQLMIKRGVPEGAVIAKMKSECISKEDQNLVLSNAQSRYGVLASFGGINTDNESATDKHSKQSTVDSSMTENKEFPEHLTKFQVMLKRGVPLQAVVAKMSIENISTDDQKIVMEGKGNSIQSIPFQTPHPKKVDGPKLLGLHWEPIDKVHSPSTVSETATSLWKNLATRRSSTSALQDDELKNLVSLFARKETSKAKDDASGIENITDTGNKTNPWTSGANSKSLRVIDFPRSMSISIVLTAFRSRAIDITKICAAVSSLNTAALQLEDVIRLKEILPTDSEIKSFKDLAKNSEFSANVLTDAENVLFHLANIDQLKQRVTCMVFLNTWESSLKSISDRSDILCQTVEQIMQSKGLEEIMHTVLTIGNAMNGGTWKGSAVGFRLSSLPKLNQTKSSDGKCTVLDYITQILYSRHQSGDKSSTIALDVTEELSSIINNCKTIALSDIMKDVHILESESKNLERLMATIPENSELLIKHDVITTEIAIARGRYQANKAKIREFEIYFGEKADSCSQMLNYLDEFLKAFKFAKEKFISKSRKAERSLNRGKGKKADV